MYQKIYTAKNIYYDIVEHSLTQLKYKCEVIYKDLPYGQTTSVILDQLFSHICDSIDG